MSEFSDVFAAAMRAARDKQKISQEKLAQLAGVSTDTIGNIERCDTEPSVEALVGITRALGLDVQAMISVAGSKARRPLARLRHEAEAASVASGLTDKALLVWIEIGRLLSNQKL